MRRTSASSSVSVRIRRLLSIAVSGATIATFVSGTGVGVAAATAAKRPAAPDVKRAVAHPFPLHQATPSASMPGPRHGSAWPASADADVAVSGAAAADTVPLSLVRPATAAVHGAASAALPANVHVQMWDQATAAKAGVNGVMFTLTPAAGTALDKATAVVDYSGFANAGSADFGSRLRLVELPECALATPQKPACQVQTPLHGGTNDSKKQTLSADVAFGPAAPAPSLHLMSLARMDATTAISSTMVLAATADSSGSNGDFTATSLSPSGSWSAGGASGAFTWSYPIAVPPVAAGSAPSVALSYASASIDGRTATTNNQPSWLGEGWDYSPGFIERTYEPCSTFTDLPTASQTGDNCWAGQILTLSLNGKTNALVWDPVTGQVKLQSDDGSRVNRLTGATNGAQSGEYWKVTTPDGTQYFFGRGGGPGQTTQGGTSSTWTEPVFGAHSGDPCYNSSGFSSSVCTQAWRWNLDYVEDAHGNATMYYYTPETGLYGQNNSTTGVSYTRGGYLNKIDYGLRDENGTVYGPATPDQVLFTVAERCIPGTPSGNTCADSQFTTTNSSYWPDVPVDQNCAAGATCNVHSPTFWSRKMLANITTQYWNGSAYVKADSYDIGHQFPNGGDPALWLSSITRTGFAADGTSIAMPTITTKGQLLPNRVPNYNSLPPMLHWRMTNLDTDTGEVISVGYSTSCSSTTIPSDASTNTTQCMPVYWTPTGYTAPIFDWFDKYVVTSVNEADPSALTPPKVTSYVYVGGAAWHYDDNEVVKPANRTYGQFRGYGEVDVKTGNTNNGEQLTKAATFYYRGMNGDTLPGGKTRSASITNTLGETLTDDYRFVDSPYETQSFNGDGGAEISATLTGYTVVATTATRPRTGLPALTADLVRTAKSRSLTDLAAGGVRTTTTVNGYDSAGRPISADATGDGVPELCTTTAYADNTTAWIRTKPSEVIESQQACPPSGTAQTTVLADTRTYYDGSTTLGQLSGTGNATRNDVLNNTNGAAPAFYTKTTTGYDTSGRVIWTADALNHTTSTAYTPSDIGPLTKTVVTNPLNQATTTVTNPDRGTKASITDIDGHATSATYDALGRLTQLWKPGRLKGQVTPNETYSYLVQTGGPEAVTTNVLVDYGSGTNYVTSTKLMDALGRVVQTQTAAEGGGSQVADTFYDGHGWTVAINDHYLISQAPSTTVQQVSTNAVDARTVDTFDGSGRVTLATSYEDGNATKTTRTVYGGDRTTVVPPAGGITNTTITDARGHTAEFDQYTTAPTINGNTVSGGASQPTTYQYDALGRQTQVASGGSTWTYTLDMVGNKLSQTDPDTGTTNTFYDLAGQVSSTTDARGQTLAYAYDALGRKTAEYSGSITGTKLASWLWDTLQAGRLTNKTRYTPAGNYITGTTGYDGAGNPTSQLTVIPANETGLNKSYITRYAYSTTNLELTVTPAPITGMPGETITNTYDQLGNAVGVHGTSVMASETLNGYGLPAQVTDGSSTNNAWLSYTYDVQTLLPTDMNLTAQVATPQIDDSTYSYDPSGQVTQIDDTQGPKGSAPVDDQCFTYDALDRLSAAWTATDSCAGAPNNAAGGNIGGPNPYWTSWTFNANSDRSTQTQHALPTGGTDVTTSYCYNPGGSHSLAATTTSGTCPTTPGYTYDAAGNTTGRPNVSGSGSQSLSWDAESRLTGDTAAAGATSWVYDADGNETVRHDPSSTTIFLPGQEVTRTSAGVISTVRYYSIGALSVGVSNGTTAGTAYVVGDRHGTNQIAVNTTTLAVTRRALDPYGNARGIVAGGTWVDNHGFIDKPYSAATGLSDVGARKYDATTGRFISVDPKLTTSDPQSLTGYAYSDDTPVTSSDPTGLMRELMSDGGGDDSSSSDTTVCPMDGCNFEYDESSAEEFNGHFSVDDSGETSIHVNWPPNNGATDAGETDEFLTEGADYDRYGKSGGSYISPADTPRSMRSMPDDAYRGDVNQAGALRRYRAMADDIPAHTSTAAPWFGEEGGADQQRLDSSVQDLVDQGKMKALNEIAVRDSADTSLVPADTSNVIQGEITSSEFVGTSSGVADGLAGAARLGGGALAVVGVASDINDIMSAPASQRVDMAAHDAGSLAGGLAGAEAGGAIGAEVGTAFGPVGTVIGGAVGGAIGGIVGSGVGDAVVSGVEDLFDW